MTGLAPSLTDRSSPLVLEKCTAEHIELFTELGGQEYLRPYVPKMDFKGLTGSGQSYAGFIEGEIVVCAGLIHLNDWRAEAWALLQKRTPYHFLPIHQAVKRFLEHQPYHRVEAHTDPHYAQAGRWAKALGFKLEHPYKPFFLMDGRGAAEWVLIK